MRQSVRQLVILCLLLLLTACASSPQEGTASPTPTPPAPTPSPTPPAVPKRTVQFSSRDGIKLTGWLYGASGQTAVICSHMRRGSKQEWEMLAPWLAQQGLRVLAYDYRGNGDSEGDDNTSKYELDLLGAITFMQQQGANKIVLIGASIGGTTSLLTAAQTKVAGVITLSAPFISWVDEQTVRKITAPQLIINSEDDTYHEDTEKLYQVANAPKEIHIYSGAAHGTDLFYEEHWQDLLKRILTFVHTYAN
uniref:AB hydrolase-1 domain-containing protein n=1 Tax=Thermosporothrix sp. COM3 TaxID=2490863 RepID=A0A455SDC4_9CHLR|nr:hypothetical protein KTC_02310 [Thermosporothrix sp. COM3]